jgi:signal peptidase II
MSSAASLAGKRAYLLLALAVFTLDQWTKWLVERSLAPHSSHEIVPGLFHLSHVRNTGIAFGMFAARGELWSTAALAALGAGALAFIGWFFLRTPPSERLLLVGLSMTLGGAVGNLLDRVASGAVTDFLGVYLGTYRWPDFNVADSAICVGLGLMILDSFRARPHARAREP